MLGRDCNRMQRCSKGQISDTDPCSGHLEFVLQVPHQAAVAMGNAVIINRHLDGAARSDEHDELFGARNGGVDQVAL